MRLRKAIAVVLGAAALAMPVVAAAPASTKPNRDRTVEELVEELRATGLTGRDLADAAIAKVAEEFTHESAWHLWETPKVALRQGRGWSHQYNTVLLLVLRQLGFRAKLVHAARVRGWGNPWWHVGHAWVKVTIDGRTYDACASRAGHRTGDIGFTPLTVELPMRKVSRWAVALCMAPFVVATVWRAWLTGRPVPEWLYRRRCTGRHLESDGAT